MTTMRWLLLGAVLGGGCLRLPQQAEDCGNGTYCPQGSICTGDGGCACLPSMCLVAGSCIAADTPLGCGDSCEVCTAPQDGTPTCTTARTCSFDCNTGFCLSGNACVDSNTDPDNCGICGTVCPSRVCISGRCASTPTLLSSISSLTNLQLFQGMLYATQTIGNPGGTIVRVDPANPSQIIQLVQGRNMPLGLAIDSTRLYWTEHVNNTGGVYTAPLAGLTTGQMPTALATNEDMPYGIVLDVNNVYWSAEGTGNIARVAKTGGITGLVASGQQEPRGVALLNGTAYWAAVDALRSRLADGTGNLTTVASGLARPETLVVLGSALFWTTASAVSMLTGATQRDIATGQNNPIGLAFDANFVYWTNQGTAANNYNDGAVMRAPVAGGPAGVLADGQVRPWGIAVDATRVYWANNGGTGGLWYVTKPQ